MFEFVKKIIFVQTLFKAHIHLEHRHRPITSSHPAATTPEPEGSSEKADDAKGDSNSTSSESGGEGNSTITNGLNKMGGEDAEAVGCKSVNILLSQNLYQVMFEVLRAALTRSTVP